MKKIFVMMVSLTAVLSCTKNISIETPHNENSPELVHMTFTVSCEDTKTTLNSDRSVSFASGDKIAIFSNGTRYEFSAESAGHEVAFTGDIEPSGTYYAVYPYSATSNTSTVSEGTITGISVSSGSQGTGLGKFNSKQAVMVAVTNTDHLTFKHVMAFLRVTVPEGITDLKEIVVFNRDNDSSNTAGAITGTFNVTPSADDAPSIEVTTANFQAGLVGPSGSSNPMPAGDYYIPVLPAQLTAKKDYKKAQEILDGFDSRPAEWHYMQSVVFYKKNWINESKKQLEIAKEMDPSNEKYKKAYDRMMEKLKSDPNAASGGGEWNKSGSANGGGTYQDGAPQMGGDSCFEFCCRMALCNLCLNCMCNCR